MTNATENQSLFRSNVDDVSAVFGNHAPIYLDIISAIIPNVLAAKYQFLDSDVFKNSVLNKECSVEGINRLIWTENLFRCHIVTATSLVRTCRLADATARHYSDSNLPGWSSCARALLEAAGDSAGALLAIPRILAKNHRSINRCISGQEGSRIHSAKEFEDILIHYTHARNIKGKKNQNVIASHIAKLTSEYIGCLENVGLKRVRELYAHLCGYSHPAAPSVQHMFSADESENAFHVSQANDREQMKWLLQEYRCEFDDLFMVAFNPIFISLRVFHKFSLFPQIPELRKVRFDNIAEWRKIEPYLQ